MKRFVTAVAISALALTGTSACATKKMVRQRVGEVNDKVDTLSKSVEENQERTRANEGRIGEVDQKAQAANQRAQAANQRFHRSVLLFRNFRSRGPRRNHAAHGR